MGEALNSLVGDLPQGVGREAVNAAFAAQMSDVDVEILDRTLADGLADGDDQLPG